jgi:glucose/arabinose dehydrogenase
LILFAAAALPEPIAAATVPPGFTETTIASGLANPTAMAVAPDGRIFICQQGGQLRVVKDDVLLPAPLLTVTVSSAGERGLLGVAVDPAFEINQYIYVYYTATTPTVHNRLSRFTANGDVAAPGSEVVLLDLNPLSSATNHNGGAIHFGFDGTIYIGVGENASGANAQTRNNLLGKILRINADGSIPSSNPFFTQASGVNRAIWALGLRNPFTFAFEPVTGRMLINDVGQDTWEEVNEGQAGANYGWPDTEGPTTDGRFTSPIYAYTHAEGCAISGAAFYPVLPSQFPSQYAGDYFFADFCAGWIRQLDFSNGVSATQFASGIASPVDLAVGLEGSLYYLARGTGSSTGVLVRVDFSRSDRPVITGHPAGVTIAAGQTATFRVTAVGTPPLSYQWQRNGIDIAGATSPTYMLSGAQQADSGAQFRCRVTNASGAAISNAAGLTVTIGRLPQPTILTPAAGALYTAGLVVNYSGAATDAEDGRLGPERFTWEVVFHHDTHTHPFLAPRSGVTRGTFVIPVDGETSTNVWYRIRLTVTDSNGQQATTFRDVQPRITQLTLASTPGGLTLTLDSQPVVTPFTFTSVVGMRRTIGAASRQTVGGVAYEFREWSDDRARTHTIVTPSTARRIVAVFRVRTSDSTRLRSPVDAPDPFSLPSGARPAVPKPRRRRTRPVDPRRSG